MLKISTSAAFEPDLFPPDGILTKEFLNRLKAAENIEALARKKAAQYLWRAREVARSIRKEARQTGYAEGLSHFAAAIDRLDETRNRLEGSLDKLLRQSMYGVLGRMPKEEWLADVLQHVLAELQGEPEIVIMTHPASMRALTTAIAAVRKRDKDLINIRAEPNPQMAEEECLVYAGLEVIDVSLPVVVEEMIAALAALPLKGEGAEE